LIFGDTAEWIGDAERNDDFHDSSHQLIESIRVESSPVGLTTDFIIDETVTILGNRKWFGASTAGG